jgi:hypothetical protein
MAIRSNFGGYFAPGGIATQAVQTQIVGQVDKLLALIPDITVNAEPASPHFDQIHPEYSVRLRNELNALKDAIDDMPVS